MPIRVQKDLPVKATLENENIFVMDESRAMHQDIRPIEIAILNLMPLKEDTELQLLRCMSNTSLQVNITFLTVESHESSHTALSHLNQFYQTINEVKEKHFDGVIITGAPVEKMEFEETDYWEELKQIMDWADAKATSTLYICWGAQAGLYHHYGVRKYEMDSKLSGIYNHRVLNRKVPIVRGFDDVFRAPHSRYTGLNEDDLAKAVEEDLVVLAESDEAGPFILMGKDGRRIFVTGHPEYDRLTLDKEYRRDMDRGLNPDIPVNYYPDDNPENKPLLTWRSTSNALYSNWLNYYVYQVTPYNLEGAPDFNGKVR